MIHIKGKTSRKNNRSGTHLITNYRLLITAMLLPAALLSGCMGIYEGGFECPAGVGVGCKSISEVNAMVDQGVLPQTSQGMTSDDNSNTTRCENWGRSFSSNSDAPQIWINPLYLKETQAKNRERKVIFTEEPHQHRREEIKQEKGLHDKIFI
jgi:hypothetical protein